MAFESLIVVVGGKYYGDSYEAGDTIDVSSEDTESVGKHIKLGHFTAASDEAISAQADATQALADAATAQDAAEAAQADADLAVIKSELQAIVAGSTDFAEFKADIALWSAVDE